MIRDYRRIEGYEDYIISNYGEVYSLKCGRAGELNATLNKRWGYKYVTLLNGERKKYNIHILVGNAFIGKREGGLTFDHIDRNRINNRADNIRLATRQEQAVNTGVCKNNKLGEKYITIDTVSGNEYYKIKITRNKIIILNKRLNKNKFSLDDAIKVRNEFLLTT